MAGVKTDDLDRRTFRQILREYHLQKCCGFSHVVADFISLASTLRISLALPNVAEEKFPDVVSGIRLIEHNAFVPQISPRHPAPGARLHGGLRPNLETLRTHKAGRVWLCHAAGWIRRTPTRAESRFLSQSGSFAA